MRQARSTRHKWLIACDANMCPEDFEKSLWFQSRHMFIKAPRGRVSTCRSKSPQGELIERTYDNVIASRRLQREIRNMDVVGDFESRPHNAVSFVVDRDREFQVWREPKVFKAVPGFSGEMLRGRSKGGKGKEEEDEEEENQERR